MKRLTIGIFVWAVLLSLGICSFSQRKGDARTATDQVGQYLFGQRNVVELKFSPDQVFKVGDVLYYWESDIAKPVGIITRVETPESIEMGLVYSSTAYAKMYPGSPTISENDFVTYHATPDTLGWVLEVMLPPEKRQEITQLILETYRSNEKEIATALKPIIQRTIEESAQIIHEDLRTALSNRSDQLQKVGNRLQVDLVKEDIIPLIRREVWPVIQRESEPVLNSVGQEIWQQASVWRFGWRYLYDSSPLPRRDLTRKEFDRFVAQTALPVIESHVEDFMQVQRNVLKEVSENKRVQKVVSDSVREFLNDPEVQDLFGEIFNEVMVANPRLQEVWQKNWSSEEAQKAIAMTNEKMEPTITRIGESLFGNPTKKITPEFSWALRSRVLRKDARWLVLNHDANAPPQTGQVVVKVSQGTDYKSNPFHIPARPRN